MEEHEIKKLIEGQMICRIAFRGDEYPYIAPFHYIVIDGSLYFHFTGYGRKMKLLNRNEQVCVEIEKYLSDLSEYGFVALIGKLKIVEELNERARAIEKMAEQGKQKLSTNFLATHGFRREEGWSTFTPDKSIVIVKLIEISKIVALKSP